MKTLLLAAVLAGFCGAADAQVTVHLYNLAGIPAETLDRATREASRVFAQADVSIVWESGDPDAEEAHTTDQSGAAAFRDRQVRNYLVVRIGRGLAVHVPPGALGVSLPHAQYGVSATIFEERVENLCHAEGQDLAVILGHAIAHELGHVLLASDEHAPNGIMRARWGRAELDLASGGRLGFPAKQGAEMPRIIVRARQLTGRAMRAAPTDLAAVPRSFPATGRCCGAGALARSRSPDRPGQRSARAFQVRQTRPTRASALRVRDPPTKTMRHWDGILPYKASFAATE